LTINVHLNKIPTLKGDFTAWVKKFVFSSLMKTIYLYNCDQPIVSETTKCESVDFIQTIDDQDKMFCTFMCEG